MWGCTPACVSTEQTKTNNIMNKKLLFGLFAAVSMLFATSCSQEEPAANLGNTSKVTFKMTAASPVGQGQTISDGLKAKSLSYEVYHHDAEGKLVKVEALCAYDQPAFEGGLEHKVDLTLAKGQTYSIAFWAQNADCTAYQHNQDLQNIEVSYDAADVNNESRDAFFGQTTVSVAYNDFEEKVTLKRPFAQLNFAVTDYDAAVAAGIAVDKVTVAISGTLATGFNAFTGVVTSDTTDVTLSGDIMTDKTITVDLNGDDTKEAYKWLSMNYLLANDITGGYNSVINKVEFTLGSTGTPIVFTEENTPLQRNYRTNFIASLTNTGTFNLVIDPIYENDNNIWLGGVQKDPANPTNLLLSTADDIKTIAEVAATTPSELAGKTITLTSDITITDGTQIKVWSSENRPTFDGQGHTISGLTAPLFTSSTINIKNVIIADANIVTTGSYLGALAGNLYGNVDNCHVKGATIESLSEKGINIGGLIGIHNEGHMTNCSAEDVTLKAYHSVGGLVGRYNEGTNRTYANNSVEGANLTVTCTEGVGTKQIAAIVGCVNAAGLTLENSAIENCNVMVAAGHNLSNVKETGTTYAIGTAESLSGFAAAVNGLGKSYAGETVKLTADIDLAGVAWTPVGQTGATQFLGTFDGQNHTISNLSIDDAITTKDHSTALFGWIERHGNDADYLMAVKNVKVDGATVKGHHNVAVIAGYLIGTIENCHVTGAEVVCSHANDDACGDKAGVIAGIAAEAKALITGCSAANSTVKASRDAGQIVGACIVGKVENCSATNVTVESLGDCTGANIANELIGRTK